MTTSMIGDSRPTQLYSKQFVGEEEAQSICDIVCKYCSALPSFNGQKPRVHFSGHTHNKRRHGFYRPKSMDVVLNIPSWGILAHELSHVCALGHGAEFAEAHSEVLDFMETMAKA